VFVLRSNFHQALTLTQSGNHYLLRLHKDVSFLNKAVLRGHLASIPPDSELVIDGNRALFVDNDILETIVDFVAAAEDKHINVEIQGVNLENVSASSGH
jgi:MFS superfamily sulfate permease-like transporter